jgi:hypothetical protein
VTRIEERRGFEILLEAPPSSQSLWAALVTSADPTLFAELGGSEQVCLAYTRERALANARAFVDNVVAISIKSAQ